MHASHTTPSTLALLLICVTLLVTLSGCAVTTHDVDEMSALPSRTAPQDWITLAREPGHIALESITSATWVITRSGLINMAHPRARAASLEEGAEPIHISMHALTHPTRGTFLIDSGVARSFEPGGEEPPLSALLASQMNLEELDVKMSMADWLEAPGHGPLAGVFLTHLHLDHIMGVPDVPASTPLYTGPQETQHREFMNLFTRGTTDRLLDGKRAIHTWQFKHDPTGRFEGVLDVFGDGEVFALHVPGHTSGSTAFLVRTTRGPVLLTGDASHTAWGWEHCVEPGDFNSDGAGSAESLRRLKALEADLPTLRVVVGHQDFREGRSEVNRCEELTMP